MEEKIERVRQYCLYFLEDFPEDLSDKEFDNYVIKIYPLIKYEYVTTKSVYFDLADALFEINHPQYNYISGLLNKNVFFGGRDNNNKLNEIYKGLKDNPLEKIENLFTVPSTM